MECPRCGNGTVCKATVAALPVDLYVCDGCEALWLHPQAIGPATYVRLEMYLQSQDIAGGRAALGELDRTWDEDPELAGLRKAVAADPEDVPARIRLGELLLRLTPREAIEHAAFVLAREPANLQALAVASQAAGAIGDDRAEGYARLLSALGGVPAPTSPAPASTAQAAVSPATPAIGNPASHPEQGVRPRLRVVDPDEPEDASWRAEGPTVTLADVAGMEAVKKRLNVAFLAPLRNPELRRLYGKSLRGGLLLYGPPGCGKTFVARATSGELRAKFISIGLSDVLDMWLGESERHLHEIFETARRNAPTVLFFDEIDALGQKRSQMRHSAGRNIVNQLLAEMDGVTADNDGIFVLGATNHPWDVDTALLRPGRLDRMVLVLPPDEPARKAVLDLHLAGRPTQGVDTGWIAARTKDFSGADLAHLCESAAEVAMEDSVNTGRTRPIGLGDFKDALKEVRPSTRSWFETARTYAMFANDGGIYDELLAYMRANKLI